MVKLKDLKWDEIKAWIPTPLDFMTHLNYTACMRDLSENLKIYSNIRIATKSTFKKDYLNKKLRLVKVIKNSIDEEFEKTKEEREFGKICSIWIPVKSYYLIFNLLLIVHALIHDSKGVLNFPHSKVINLFKEFLDKNKISFNKAEFNLVSSCEDAIAFSSTSGDTLRKNIPDNLRAKSVLKKLCKYKFEDYCRSNNIKNFRKKLDKAKKISFFKNNNISLFEFFYWYRIKTNYRDLAFLDQEIDEDDVIKFYENYYSLTINFFNALKGLINEISFKRFDENLI